MWRLQLGGGGHTASHGSPVYHEVLLLPPSAFPAPFECVREGGGEMDGKMGEIVFRRILSTQDRDHPSLLLTCI